MSTYAAGHTVGGCVAATITVHPGGSLILMGVAEGGVVVPGGGHARIAGTTKSRFVATGGQAVLTGTCVGSATDDGGELTIEGVVTRDVIERAGTTQNVAAASIQTAGSPSKREESVG